MSDGLPYLSISFVVAMKGPITLEVTFMLALNLGNKLTFHGVHPQVLLCFVLQFCLDPCTSIV